MCANLLFAARAVTRLYERHLAELSLTITQYTVLRTLEYAGRLRQNELAHVLNADPTTLSRTLQPVRARGLVASGVGPDKRERLWSLTAAGRKLLTGAQPRWAAAQAQLAGGFNSEQWETLARLLMKAGKSAA